MSLVNLRPGGRFSGKRNTFAMLRWYLTNIRCQFACVAEVGAMFVTASGRPLVITGMGVRFQRAVHAADLRQALPSWNIWMRSGGAVSGMLDQSGSTDCMISAGSAATGGASVHISPVRLATSWAQLANGDS